VKEPTVRAMFVERMKRDGRDKEWYAKVKEVRAATGKPFNAAAWQAMKEMGYEGPEKEKALYREYQETLHLTSEQKSLAKEREAINEERRIESFEEAMKTLPDEAPPADEIRWQRTHPVMLRRSRDKNKIQDILLTADDILYPINGKAPSKAAVIELQYWVNHPTKFYEQLMGERKKTMEGSDTNTPATKDAGLPEIERLLDEVQGGNEPKESA
jgi:hypothetical protein